MIGRLPYYLLLLVDDWMDANEDWNTAVLILTSTFTPVFDGRLDWKTALFIIAPTGCCNEWMS